MATWTISTLEHNTADGGVIVAHWRVTDSETVGEETYSASAYSTASFTYDASSPDFIPYADLTEEVVLGWCWADGVDKDAVEASLTANIEEQKNPVTEAGVPW
mgnify:FL=1|jgi:hypothetical protein